MARVMRLYFYSGLSLRCLEQNTSLTFRQSGVFVFDFSMKNNGQVRRLIKVPF
jgi:hypothetical protein